MPTTVLSNDDVFGTGAEPTPPVKASKPAKASASLLSRSPTAGDTLSHDDVFGKGKGGRSPVQVKKAPEDRSLIREGFAVADLLTTGPVQMVADVLGQTVGRTVAAFHGASRKESIEFGKDFGHDIASHPAINQPLTKLFNWVAGQKNDSTRVDDVMGEVSSLIHKGGKYVQKFTKGAIRADDVDLLAEGIMAGAGARGQQKLLEMRKGKVDPAAPPAPAAERAKRDVKKDIEEATGVSKDGGKTAALAKKARRDDAKAAFKEDPEYADYLRNYAEEEARQREAKIPQTAPGGNEGSGPRADRTGLRDAAPDKTLPPGRTPPVETGESGTLDSALAKVRKGRSFDLTSEERIAMRGVASQHGRPPIVDAQGKPMRGAASPDMMRLIAGLGLGTGLAAYAYYHKDEFGGAAALALGTLFPAGDRTALSSALRDSGYTLKTLERLPQNATSFTREQVLQHLNRDDVSKAEKELVLGVMGDKKEISAKGLVEGFQEKAKGLELRPKETDEYSDYGLSEIGRYSEVGRDRDEWASATPEERKTAEEQEVPARTTVYRNDQLDDTSNHFGDEKYFAHTRSFDEGGVRHVVEVQSDVAQHAKVLTAEKRAEVQGHLDSVKTQMKYLDKISYSLSRAGDYKDLGEGLKEYEKYRGEIEKANPDFHMMLEEHLYEQFSKGLLHPETEVGKVAQKWVNLPENQLKGRDALAEGFADWLRDNPPKDRIGAGFLQDFIAKRLDKLDQLADEHQTALGHNTDAVAPMLKTWYKRVIREEIAQTPGKPIRFATADTVAKVEGWPTNREFTQAVARAEAAVRRLQKRVLELETRIENFKKLHGKYPPTPVEVLAEVKEELKGEIEALNHNRAELKKRFPNGEPPKFSPEHQSIYDRYKSEIEKFLRNEFNAKPHIDPKGHTWLEVPPQPKGRTKMFGRASTADLAALAAFVGGATAMAAWGNDPSIVADVVAGIVASAATRIRPKTLVETIRSMKQAKPLASIAEAAIARESNVRLGELDAVNTVRRVAKLVPEEKRREAVHIALDTGKTAGLSAKEMEAYQLLKGEYAKLAAAGLDADTLKAVRSNYATHMWKMDSDIFERLFGRRQGFGTSPNTPYSLERVFNTLAEGEKFGLTAISKDAAFVFAVYANSLVGAIENAKLLKTLKGQKTADGTLLLQDTKHAPSTYVTINNPQLRGIAVHPEIAPQMRFIFENPSSAGVGSALEVVADVSKRSAVSASLFHTKALIDSLVGSVPPTGKNLLGAAIGGAAVYSTAQVFDQQHALRDGALGALAGFVGPRMKGYALGRNGFLKEMEKGSSSEFIRRAVKSGLVFGAEKGPLVVDDAGRRFYDAMKFVQKEVDRITNPVGIKGGKAVEAYIQANHKMDDVLWGRIHPAMKLEVWSKQSNILREASIERNKANPKNRILSQEEADQIAARFTNDTFGGLNWTRIAMGAKSRIGRMVAQELLSPRGRRAMRIMMFAPDWTLSTARAALAAIDKDLVNPLKWGNVAKGFFQPISRGDLARQYVARSAMYYLLVGDAINYSMSGHHIWQNKDPTFLDWGDGRRMQFSKHIMETVHWMKQPVKQALGKLGYVPKEAANQMLGTDYLSPQEGKQGQVFAGPRMKDKSPVGRVGHALGGFTPIPFQGAVDDSTAWGFAGMPLYGKTAAQKEQAKRLRDERKRKERK